MDNLMYEAVIQAGYMWLCAEKIDFVKEGGFVSATY